MFQSVRLATSTAPSPQALPDDPHSLALRIWRWNSRSSAIRMGYHHTPRRTQSPCNFSWSSHLTPLDIIHNRCREGCYWTPKTGLDCEM